MVFKILHIQEHGYNKYFLVKCEYNSQIHSQYNEIYNIKDYNKLCFLFTQINRNKDRGLTAIQTTS